MATVRGNQGLERLPLVQGITPASDGMVIRSQNGPSFRGDRPDLRVVTDLIDFSPLWETMQKKQMTQYQLLKSGVDNKTLDTLKKNKNITLVTLEKLCRILDCTPNDIVRFTE